MCYVPTYDVIGWGGYLLYCVLAGQKLRWRHTILCDMYCNVEKQKYESRLASWSIFSEMSCFFQVLFPGVKGVHNTDIMDSTRKWSSSLPGWKILNDFTKFKTEDRSDHTEKCPHKREWGKANLNGSEQPSKQQWWTNWFKVRIWTYRVKSTNKWWTERRESRISTYLCMWNMLKWTNIDILIHVKHVQMDGVNILFSLNKQHPRTGWNYRASTTKYKF